MHIALFSPGWPPDEFPSGVVTYVHSLRSALLNQGHRVSVLANAIGSANTDHGIYLVKSTLRYKMQSRLARARGKARDALFAWGDAIATAAMRLHGADHIDVLEMEESFGWCADVQKRTRIPVVVKLHGPAFLTLGEDDRQDQYAARKIKSEGEALRRISAITSPAKSTLQETISRYGLTPAIGRIIRNPVATEPGIPLWDLSSCDRKTILFVGRFDRLKGGDTVLTVFRKLLDMDAELRLVFVGPDTGLTSPTGDAVYFSEFASRLFTAAQMRNIRYLGQLRRRMVFELRPQAMVTLVASRWENQPNTALEAMMQGCPIVASDSGGIREIIEHDIRGLLADPNDVGGFCRQIMMLLSDPGKAAQLGRHAQSFITSQHSIERFVDETINVYRETIRRQESMVKRAE